MNKCLQCAKEISDKAKYCSDKCRMAYTRTNKIEQPEQTQPEHEQMTPNKQPRTEIGKCHACGKEVPEYICICYDCFHKGNTHESLGLKMCSEK